MPHLVRRAGWQRVAPFAATERGSPRPRPAAGPRSRRGQGGTPGDVPVCAFGLAGPIHRRLILEDVPHHEGPGDLVGVPHLEHRPGVAGQGAGDLQAGPLPFPLAGLGIALQALLQAGQAQGLDGRLGPHQAPSGLGPLGLRLQGVLLPGHPGQGLLPAESLLVRLARLGQGLVLDLLRPLQHRQLARLLGAHEVRGRLGVGDDGGAYLHPVGRDGLPDGRLQLALVVPGQVAHPLRGQLAHHRPQGLLAHRLEDVVEVVCGDVVDEAVGVGDGEGDQAVHRSPHVVRRRGLGDGHVEGDLAPADQVRDGDHGGHHVHPGADHAVVASAPHQEGADPLRDGDEEGPVDPQGHQHGRHQDAQQEQVDALLEEAQDEPHGEGHGAGQQELQADRAGPLREHHDGRPPALVAPGEGLRGVLQGHPGLGQLGLVRATSLLRHAPLAPLVSCALR